MIEDKKKEYELTDEQLNQVSGGIQLIYSEDFSKIIVVDDNGNEIKD